MVRLATDCGEPLDPARVALWEDELRDLSAEQIEQACQRALRTHRFGFPKIADVRAQIDQVQSRAVQLEAGDAWDFALNYAVRWYDPDLGIKRGAPELPPRIEHAIRAAGGLHWMWGCPESELQWARKRFLEDFTNLEELGQVENMLPDGDAKRILRQLAARSELLARGTVAPPAELPERGPVPPDDAIRAEWAALGQKLNTPSTVPAVSEEEWRLRKDSQLARYKRHLSEHPGLRGTLQNVGANQ